MECSRCELIRDLPVQEDDSSTEGQIVLHRTIKELRDGLAASCWWCAQIESSVLERSQEKSLHEYRTFWSQIIRYSHQYFITLRYGPYRGEIEHKSWHSLSYKNLSSAVKLERRTDSSESWQYIQHRLRECEASHKETCGSTTLQDRAPTWLIKIEEQKDSRRRCHLIKSSSEASIEDYVTMSHRWQPKLIDQKKLCTSNLKDYQNHIPMEELPKHYADAVEVTWKLGLKYLWIDFLVSFILRTLHLCDDADVDQCIVQDSEDLGQEIGRMSQIYQNAYCNLSAASADQGTEGLFFDRDLLRLPHIFRTSDNHCQYVELNDPPYLFQRLDSEPLYRRGWVCQERLLARRNISFTKDLIFIECHSSIDCEIGPADGIPGSSFFLYRGPRVSIGIEEEYVALGKFERHNLLPFWGEIVGFYSQSELTYPDDRLIAISGLARYIAHATKVDYLAGLWNDRLPIQLSWRKIHQFTRTLQSVPPKDDAKDDAKVGRAPSWSWTNTDGPISFFVPQTGSYTPVVEILEAKCEGPYESKSTGFIRLHGWVTPFCNQKNVAIRKADRENYWVDIGFTQKLKVSWDEFPAQRFTCARIAQELTKDCYALPLYLYDTTLHGIMVTLTPKKNFRRIGIWHIDSMEDSSKKRRYIRSPWPGPRLDEYLVLQDAPYILRVLLDFFGECDLPFLKTVSGGRRLITLV